MKLLYLSTFDIRFTRNSIPSRLPDGYHVNTVANELTRDSLDGEDLPTMEVFWDDQYRNYFTRNNLMLYPHRVAEYRGRIDGIPVFVVQKTPSDYKMMNTKNGGATVCVEDGAKTLRHFDWNRDLSNDGYLCLACPTSTASSLRVDLSLASVPRHRRDRILNYDLDIRESATAIYTDGSKFPDCAGIAMYIPDHETIIRQRCSNRLSSYDLELKAILFALTWIVVYGDSSNYAILSDCLNCIKVIGHSGEGSHSHQHRILRDIIPLHDQATNLGSNIKFVWVPGHAGIEGNEIADEYAREAASDESSEWDPIWTNEYEY